MARRLLHRVLLLYPVGPSIEQKFDRQAAPRLHARLVGAMGGAHHVAAAIGTDPGRFQPKISVEPTLGAPEILLDTFHGTVRRADDGVVDQAGCAEARCLAPALVPIQALFEAKLGRRTRPISCASGAGNKGCAANLANGRSSSSSRTASARRSGCGLD